MVRLIDADAMKEYIDCGMCFSELDVVNLIDEQPTVDAEPVRHGKWGTLTLINTNNGTYTMNRCSECGLTIMDRYKYCPNCGCRMDKDD